MSEKSARILSRPATVAVAAAAGLVVTLLAPVGSLAAEPADGVNGSTLMREPLVSPQELGADTQTDLMYADPTEQLSLVAPPDPDSSGVAALDYPIVLPKGRGMTPELAISYTSGGASGWTGLGWDLSVGDVSVDTEFGVPLFCPRDVGPKCDDVESESYTLDGEPLLPSAVRSSYLPRIAEREDFTGRVETQYRRIIRHGTNTKNYSWEVVDKEGAIKWYGSFPDSGGPFGEPGTRSTPSRNDEGCPETDPPNDDPCVQDEGAILFDDEDNAVRWYLSGERDVGVNFFRYEYKTVYYRASQQGEATSWVELPGKTCPDNTVCARHVYLSKILYTGVGEQDITKEEDPAYEINFVRRDAKRIDGVLDATGGFLDLDQELLGRIDVRFVDTGELVTRYRLEYKTGRFGKSLLSGVTQIGCTGDGVDDCAGPDQRSEHTFNYFDDIEEAGTGFTPVQWDTRDDNMNKSRLVNRASALGMATALGGDGQVYIGYNSVAPDKNGSFGGSITLEGATTESLLEFLDINGDGLPDKVFRDNPDLTGAGTIRYRLNTSTPGGELDEPVTFAAASHAIGDPASKIDRLPVSREFGVTGGIEAYFGVVGVFNVGGSWDFAQSYFNDVNNDGLPDFVLGTEVYFNHLNCGGNGLADKELCVPTFSKDDSQTRVPLTVQSIPLDNTDIAKQVQRMRELAPPVDTVRRWVAPWTGTVEIAATATLEAPPEDETLGGQPVDLAIQQNSGLDPFMLETASLDTIGDQWVFTDSVEVTRGDRIYFRVKARRGGSGDDVTWDQTMTYPDFATKPTDVNGLDQSEYIASQDFTLAGRPGGTMSLPEAGTGRFAGAITKGATTDDITPRVRVQPNAGGAPINADVDVVPITAAGLTDTPRVKTIAEDNGEWCVTDSQPTPLEFGCFDSQAKALARTRMLGAAETGRFRFEATFPVTAIGAGGKADTVATWLEVDSPVDVTEIDWVGRPVLCYAGPAPGCDPNKAILSPPVDIDIYPTTNVATPVEPWDSTLGRTVTPVVTIDVASGDGAGDVILTVKQPDGYLYKTPINVDAGGGAHTLTTGEDGVPALPDLTLADGEDYWFDLTVRSPALSERLSSPTVTLTWSQSGTDHTLAVPVTLNAAGQQGIFPLAHRGWAYAGYRAEDDRKDQPIHEDDFRIGPATGGTYDDDEDACAAQPGGCRTSTDGMGFDPDYPVDENGRAKIDLSSAKDQIPLTFAYLPVIDEALSPSWQVVDQPPRLMGTATSTRSGRLADVPAMPGTDPDSVSAPALWGAAGPIFTFMVGIGPAQATFAFGWTSSVIDFMDMNADGYPDIVRPGAGAMTFTNPRGGRGCIKDSAMEPCTGDGPEVVQEGLTLSAGLGIGGAPIGISANSKGVGNSTQGNATTKGGSASSASKGGELGVAIGAGASFSNFGGSPDADFEDDLAKIPDTSLQGNTTAPTQRLLADLNGDGLPDQVKVSPQGVFVKFNLGYSYAPRFVQWNGGAMDSNESYSGSLGGSAGFQWANYGISAGVSGGSGVDFSRMSWEDVNGDGILDALFKKESNHTVEVSFGTGTRVMNPDAKYANMASHPFNVFPGIESDISGSTIRQDQAQSVGGGLDLTIGIPLCLAACYLIISAGGHVENSLSTADVDITDVNGDGYADSVSRVEPSDAEMADGNHEKLDVLLNTTGRTGLLKQVVTPMRGTIDLDYERKGNTLEHPESMWVMSDVTVKASRGNDGVADQRSEFTYEHARFSFVHRADLGFSRVVEEQLDTRAATRTVMRSIEHIYRNGSVFDTGLETRTTTYTGPVSAGVKVAETTTDWSVLNLQTGLPLVLDGVSTDDLLQLQAAPLVDKLTQTAWRGADKQDTVTDYEYDDLGNPTVIDDRGDPINPDDDVVAHLRYSDCTIAADWELNVAFGCSDGFPGPNPDLDPSDVQDYDLKDVPLRTKPEAVSPYWNKNLCSTWTSVPVTLEIRDAAGDLLRYRDARSAVCNNTSVTYVQEMIEEGPTIAGSTFAITELTYDKYGSYDRIVYPEDVNGLHYAVHYVYDPARGADVARVTDLSLDADQVAEFLALDSMVEDSVVDWIATLPAESVGITSVATFDGPSGRVESRTDANGNLTDYDYDPLGRTRRIDFPDGGWVDFAYAPSDPQYPYAVARNYDAFASDSNPDKTIDTATFVDGSGRVTGRKRDAEFFTGADTATSKGWSVEGASELDALGRVVKEWYPTDQTDGALTDYWDETPDVPATAALTVWDTSDRVTRETDFDGNVTTTGYAFGTLGGAKTAAMTVTDPLLRKTVTWTDVHDNVVAVDDVPIDPLLPMRRTAYDTDALGQLHEVASPGGETIVNTYDLLGQRLSTETPDGGLTEYVYDPAGNVITEATPRTRALDPDSPITNEYEFGHLVRTTYPDDTPEVALTWGGYGGVDPGDNGAGQIIGVDDAARHQILGYDENGRVDFEESTMLGDHPNNGPFTTEFDQDWLGRLGTVKLPDGEDGGLGETVTNGYDAGGRLNRVTGTKSCHDLGDLVTAIDATQTTITVREHTTASPALPFVIKIDGEELRVTGRLQSPSDPEVWIYTVERGINGTILLPTNVAHALGATVNTLDEVTCAFGYLDRREYDEFGVLAFQQVDNGIRTRLVRNPATRRLEEIRSVLAGTSRLLQNQIYVYDKVGNVKEARNDLPKDLPSLFGGPSKQTYNYDGRYRIKHAEGTWDYEPSLQRKYAYDTTYNDVTGNMTSAVQVDRLVNLPCKGTKCDGTIQTGTSYSHSSISYSPDGAHQYSVLNGSLALGNKQTASYFKQFSYDDDGNVARVTQVDNIREITWDAADKMTRIVDHNANNTGRKETSYKYDYNGELAIEKKETGESFFVNPWITVRNGTMWKHVWAGQDRLATKFAQDDTFEEKIYYLHKDLQGSTNIATDRTGKVFQHHEYFPSGEVWIDEASTVFRTPYQFGGGYTDEDHDLINFGQRWYAPGTQSFMSVDPILTQDPGAIVGSPELRLSYAYARNNPLSYVDSSGQKFTPVQDAKVAKIKATLKLDDNKFVIGTPSTADQQRFDGFFAKHQGRRGRMALYWLSRQKEGLARQEFAEKFGTKRMLEFEFEDGKLSAIKLGAGFGPRKKFDFSAPASSTPTTSPPPSQAAPPSPGRTALTSASKTNPTTNLNAAAAQPGSGSGPSPPSPGSTIGGHRSPPSPPPTSQTSSGGGVGVKQS